MLRKCYAMGRVHVSLRRLWMAEIVVKSRVGAEMYARHPMASPAVVVGALWKQNAVVVPSKVSEWLGRLKRARAGYLFFLRPAIV
jgi:hypothetical protein